MNNLNLNENEIIIHLKKFQEYTDPLATNQNIKKELDHLYERFLDASEDIFKILKDKDYSKKKWQSVFSPWLRYFLVSIIYKKNFYNYLIENNVDLFFLENNQKETIKYFYDHNDFMFHANNLQWNIECLKIFYNLNLNKNLSFEKQFEYKTKNFRNNTSIKKKIYFFIIGFFKKFFLNKKFTYFTFPNRFSFFDKILLFIKTNRGVYFENENLIYFDKNFKHRPDLVLRDKIKEILLSKGIDILVASSFSLFIPLSKLENYNFYKSLSSKEIVKNKINKTIFTQASHIDNEVKLHQLYEDMKKNKTINIVQHGNNYDLIDKKFHTGIEHEYFFNGNLYTWGWSNNAKEKKITSPRIMKFKSQFNKLENNFEDKNILYVLGPSLIWNFPRSQHISHNFHHISNEMRIKFNQNIESDLKKKIIFRNYPYKSYDGMRNLDESNDLKNLNFSKNKLLARDVSQSFLLIFDHLSTANLECTITGKPFFLFFKLDNYLFSNKGFKVLKELKDQKILQEDPVKFSKLLSTLNYENIKDWWFEGKREQSVNNFINEYAYFSDTAIDDWSKLINSENNF